MTEEILVLGANGYIGRHVAKELKEEGQWRVSLSDLHQESLDGWEGYIQEDLVFPKKLRELVRGKKYIFFLAGLTGTERGFQKPIEYLQANENTLLNLLSALSKEEQKGKIIFPSTRLVYRGKKDHPLREEDPKEFKTLYSISKYAGEQYLEMYRNRFSIDYTVLRICVPYGNLLSTQTSYGTMTHFISQAREGKKITVYGEGEQKRTLTHVADLSRLIIQAGLSPQTNSGVFNIGGPDNLSIREIAQEIGRVYGTSVEFIPWPPSALALEAGDTLFNSSKLDSLIQYKYQYQFHSWIKKLGKH